MKILQEIKDENEQKKNQHKSVKYPGIKDIFLVNLLLLRGIFRQ
jgi:hypothetical protein